jgi:hypothetical protein
MSYSRSPRALRSTTIGTSGIVALNLAVEASESNRGRSPKPDR